jgi:hypothetical protein
LNLAADGVDVERGLLGERPVIVDPEAVPRPDGHVLLASRHGDCDRDEYVLHRTIATHFSLGFWLLLIKF